MHKAFIPALLAALIASGCATTASGGVASHDHHKHNRHSRALAAHQTCAKSGASRTTSGTSRAGGILLGPGETGTRTQVPWAKIGSGWVLAEYSATTVPGSSTRPKLGPVSLYLIDPAGGKYLMYRWPAITGSSVGLIDWSPDGSKALVEQAPGSARNAPIPVSQITLATGRVTTFHVPWNVYPQAYTYPDGQAMLATSGNQQVKLIRYCLTGRRGPVLASTDNGYVSFAQSKAGTIAVPWSRGISLVSGTGAIIRRLPVPGARATAGGCNPVRWWNARAVLAVCAQGGLWLVPSDGTSASQLSPARNGRGVDPGGDIGAWELPSGLYLQAVGACSQLYIVRQLPNSQVQSVHIPGTYGNNNRIIDALGTRLLVRAQTGCPGSDSLLWFNPATRAIQMLLPAPRDVSGVLAAIPRVS